MTKFTNSNLNILMIYPNYGYMWPQSKDIKRLSRYFAMESGIDVSVISKLGGIEYSNDLVESAIKFYPLKSFNSILKDLSASRNLFEKIINKLKKIFLERDFRKNAYKDIIPFSEIKKCCKYFNKNKIRFDAIISFSNPFYIQQYAEYMYKKLHVKKWIPYILDPHADAYYCHNKERAIKEEQNVFNNAYKIYLYDEFIEKSKFSTIRNYLSKVQCVPVHIMIDNTNNGEDFNNTSNEVRLCYCGTLMSDIRNPEKLLQAFLMLPENYVLSFYSKGCEDIIERYKMMASDRILNNGRIMDSTQYDEMIHSQDVLISIGNTVSNQIPSKIFDYCSYGKPIIHFINSKDDEIKNILKFYPLIKFIDYNNISNVAEDVVNFINEVKGKSVSYDLIEKFLKEYLVETIGSRIINDIKGLSDSEA